MIRTSAEMGCWYKTTQKKSVINTRTNHNIKQKSLENVVFSRLFAVLLTNHLVEISGIEPLTS
jgi:hypothetical protein